jgi:MYXO-CTERM domain-containing protein
MRIMRSALFVAAFSFLSVGVAHAHFHLNEPAATLVQATNGDPQKVAPCGGAGTASNAVTTYTPGGMLTLKLAETISHPGHYRVAIAQDAASLPAAPPVTAVGADQCGSTVIAQNPMMPLLADGLFTAITPADGEQITQIQLPAGYECTNCVVQVIEFMSNHAAPCFYYHCATVTISNNAPAPDAGVNVTPDADTGSGSGSNMGGEISGGCSTGNATGLLALLGLVGLRRRRRHSFLR